MAFATNDLCHLKKKKACATLNKKEPWLNTGFVFLKKSVVVSQLINSFLLWGAETRFSELDDQQLFRQYLSTDNSSDEWFEDFGGIIRHGVKITVLPISGFMDFKQWNHATAIERSKVCVLHYCWLSGASMKIAMMKKQKHWTLART